MANWLSDQWPFFATIAGGVLAWFVTLERRLNSKLSLKDHMEICERAHRENMEAFRDIKVLIEGAKAERQEIRNAVIALTTQLAVLTTKVQLLNEK